MVTKELATSQAADSKNKQQASLSGAIESIKRGRKSKKLTPSDVAGLTNAGLRLLIAFQDYDPLSENISALCSSAGVIRDTYYRLINEPKFQAAVRRIGADLMAAVPCLIRALLHGALVDHDHRMMRMALVMAGLVGESRQEEGEKPRNSIEPEDNLEKINKRIKELEGEIEQKKFT